MKYEGLRRTILEFLACVEGEEICIASSERDLRVMVDRLALAGLEIPLPFADTDYQGGDETVSKIARATVCARFPDFGYYNVPAHVTRDVADTILEVGDAIDDIVDITCELDAPKRVWETEGEEQALRVFAAAYALHLGDHLRNLQWYLHARARETDKPTGS